MVEKVVVHEIGPILIDVPEKTHTVTASNGNHVATDMDSVWKGASLILNVSLLQLFQEILICSLSFLKMWWFFFFFFYISI